MPNTASGISSTPCLLASLVTVEVRHGRGQLEFLAVLADRRRDRHTSDFAAIWTRPRVGLVLDHVDHNRRHLGRLKPLRVHSISNSVIENGWAIMEVSCSGIRVSRFLVELGDGRFSRCCRCSRSSSPICASCSGGGRFIVR